jgi:4-amino-4-deoxy-L-arabinose transferase-like glycosyltransferase
MKYLTRLEKRKEIWFFLYILLLFFLLRLPSLIEPLWYGDEGVYEVIGISINGGRSLYTQIWDNKPPLLYIVYAIAKGDQYIVRLFSLFIGAFSVIPFYYLSKKLFQDHKLSAICSAIYAFLLATPLIEGNIANAENFMVLPIISAALLVFGVAETKSSQHTRNSSNLMLLGAGFLLGIAFLFKTVAIFDFAAFFLFLLLIASQRKGLTQKLFFYSVGFVVPVFVTVFYFILNGNFLDFFEAVFFGNVGYVGHANTFITTRGLLFVKVFLLVLAIGVLFKIRKSISREILFLYIWFIFAFFSAVFSGRPWTHYLLVICPSAVLMAGILLKAGPKKIKISALLLLCILFYLSAVFFKVNIGSLIRLGGYYQNFVLFVTGNRSVEAYQAFFDADVPRDYEIAQFIDHKTDNHENIFIWGNNPQIYVLAHMLPPGKYTVAYHISQSAQAIQETIADLERTNPKYIIVLPDVGNMPLIPEGYLPSYNIKGAQIYERTI